MLPNRSVWKNCCCVFRAVLKRTQNQHSKNDSEIFHWADIYLDYSKQLLIFNNENYKLSFKESELLYLLSVNKTNCSNEKPLLIKYGKMTAILPPEAWMFTSANCEVF